MKFFLIGEYLAKLQARAWLSLMYFARLANTLLKDGKSYSRFYYRLHCVYAALYIWTPVAWWRNG